MSFQPLARTLLGTLVGLSLLAGCGGAPSATLSGSSLVSAKGNSGELSLYVMPEAGPQPILDAINHARKSILMEMYILTYSGITQQITDALIAKSKAGLDVRIILENKPYIPAPVPQPGQPPAPTINVNAAAYKVLTAANVRVKRSSPQFNFTHEKSMVIDGTTAFIMTMNLSASAFQKNREYVIADRSTSDVAEVARVFQADWDETPIVPQDPDLVISPTNSRARILSLIDQAKKTLIAQCEFLDDPEIAQHLAQAQARGAVLSVMLSYQRPDPHTGDDINAKERQQLAALGVTNLRFVKSIGMHAKTIIVDGVKSYVGSENFTTNSLDRNREMGLIVSDRAIVAKLTQVAQQDWQATPGDAPVLLTEY